MTMTQDTTSSIQDLTGKITLLSDHFSVGGSAVLYKGQLDSPQGLTLIALKVPIFNDSNTDTKRKALSNLLREGNVWSLLEHPHVSKFLGFARGVRGHSSPCLVLPYYDNKDLSNYLGRYPLANRRGFIIGACSGLAYLHECGVVHGDIKANNILVSDQGEAVLSDFGLSRIIDTKGFTTQNIHGNFRWLAYELLQFFVATTILTDDDYPTPLHTFSTDVWALGMTIVEIYTQRFPLHRIYTYAIPLAVVSNGTRPSLKDSPEVPSSLWPLLNTCWKPGPLDRPSTGEIKRHLQRLSF